MNASIKPKELTKEQIAAINSYGNSIVSMKNDIEAIQKLAGMYISGKGNLGYMTIFREIYQNSIDQVIDPMSPGDYISVTFNEHTLEATILDNGKGIPFDDMIRIFTKSHTSQNYTKEKGRYLTSVNGVGSKATNAFSEIFVVESYRYDGEARRMVFKDGYPTSKTPEKIDNKNKFQGTNIYFVPSIKLLGRITVTQKDIYNLVRDIAAMMPIGTVIDYKGIDGNGKVYTEHIVNEDGINYFLIKEVKSPLVKPIMVGDDDGYERAMISFTWDTTALGDNYAFDRERVKAFSNTCPIYDAGSTNITGTLKGICNWFQKYINDIYLANSRSKVTVIPSDIKEGLCVIIDSASVDPQFSGQAKQKLTNEEMDPFCRKVVMNGLDEWSKNNPADLKKISEFIFEIAKIRTNADKEKVKISTNYEQSAFGGGLPASYKKPSGKDHLELWICEGLSALGALVQARDTSKQGRNMPHIVVIQCV